MHCSRSLLVARCCGMSVGDIYRTSASSSNENGLLAEDPSIGLQVPFETSTERITCPLCGKKNSVLRLEACNLSYRQASVNRHSSSHGGCGTTMVDPNGSIYHNLPCGRCLGSKYGSQGTANRECVKPVRDEFTTPECEREFHMMRRTAKTLPQFRPPSFLCK